MCYYWSWALLFSIGLLHLTPLHSTNVVSKSFMATGSASGSDALFYRNFWQVDEIPNGNQYSLSINPFYSRSTNSKGLARYFSPFDKDELVVREQGVPVSGGNANLTGTEQDILSYNFNIITVGTGVAQTGTFNSTIKFAPKRTTIGADLVFFAQRCNNFWVSLSTQLLNVKTDMHLTENVIISSGGSANLRAGDFSIEGVRQASNMKDAFKQPQMLYGKIDGPRSKTGLSDITLTLGYNWKREADFYLQPFAGLVLPTSNKPKAHYMFEPILGNNGHLGLFTGLHYGSVLKEDSEKTILINGTMQTTYRCPNTQKRSFDPVGNPWGRYLTVNDNTADMNAPTYRWGINRFTKDVRVSPNFTHQAQIQLNALFAKCNYQLSYKFNMQQAEEVTLNDLWVSIAFSDFDNVGGNTAPFRKINTAIDSTRLTTFSPITISSLDFSSAAQPSNTQHTFSGSASKTICVKDRDFMLDGGISYTVGQANRTLSLWNIWAGFNKDF